MENINAIYFYLFWELAADTLDDLVMQAFMQKNFERVKLLCKVIALKSMGETAESFWLKNHPDFSLKLLVKEDAFS